MSAPLPGVLLSPEIVSVDASGTEPTTSSAQLSVILTVRLLMQGKVGYFSAAYKFFLVDFLCHAYFIKKLLVGSWLDYRQAR